MRDVYHVDDKICKETGAIRFPCRQRWLKGEEYGFLIRHYFVYSRVLKFHILSEKYHPNIVYERPEGKSAIWTGFKAYSPCYFILKVWIVIKAQFL